MSKDYANKNRLTRQRKQAPRPTFVSLAAAIFAIICFVGAAVYFIHAYERSAFFSKEPVATWFNDAKTMISRENKPIKKESPPIVSPHEDIQFAFYTELPNMQVKLPQSAQLNPFPVTVPKMDKSESKQAEADHLAGQIDQSIKTVMALHVANTKNTTTRFILQLGEFNDRLSASQLRLSLLLAGIETDIVKTADQKYRVQQGPFANEHQAKSAAQKLNKKGFEGSIIRFRTLGL